MESLSGHHISKRTSKHSKQSSEESPGWSQNCGSSRLRTDWEGSVCPPWSTEGTVGTWFTCTSISMVFVRHAQTCYLCVGSPQLEDTPCGSEGLLSAAITSGLLQPESGRPVELPAGQHCDDPYPGPLPWTVSRTGWTGSGHMPPSVMTINPYRWLHACALRSTWPTWSRAVNRHCLKNRRGYVYIYVCM